MNPEKSIALEIERLEAARADGSINVAGEERLVYLNICASILCSRCVNFRSLVREVVAGRMGEVAQTVGVRRATLSVYLKGTTSLSSDTVESILRLPR